MQIQSHAHRPHANGYIYVDLDAESNPAFNVSHTYHGQNMEGGRPVMAPHPVALKLNASTALKAIPVKVLFDTPDSNIVGRYEAWSEGCPSGPVCIGDGDKAKAYDASNHSWQAMPCRGPQCARVQPLEMSFVPLLRVCKSKSTKTRWPGRSLNSARTHSTPTRRFRGGCISSLPCMVASVTFALAWLDGSRAAPHRTMNISRAPRWSWPNSPTGPTKSTRHGKTSVPMSRRRFWLNACPPKWRCSPLSLCALGA